MNIKQSMKLSSIIDKLELKITNPKATQEEVGADLLIQVLGKLHKAEKEVYSFVAETNKITELEAEEVDLIKFISGLSEVSGLKSFFISASK